MTNHQDLFDQLSEIQGNDSIVVSQPGVRTINWIHRTNIQTRLTPRVYQQFWYASEELALNLFGSRDFDLGTYHRVTNIIPQNHPDAPTIIVGQMVPQARDKNGLGKTDSQARWHKNWHHFAELLIGSDALESVVSDLEKGNLGRVQINEALKTRRNTQPIKIDRCPQYRITMDAMVSGYMATLDPEERKSFEDDVRYWAGKAIGLSLPFTAR